MSRHLVRSFVLAAALGPFVNAGPCKPSSSLTALESTISESTEIGAATSSDVVVSTSETYALTSNSEDVSATTIQSLSSTVSESALFTTRVETSAVVSSDETTVGQSETATTASSEASTTATSGSTINLSTGDTTVVSQTDTTTAFEDMTTTILESSTTAEEVMPMTTETLALIDVTIATSETELPTTTTTEDDTLTSAEPAATTTEALPVCIDNKWSPAPEGLICGAMGGSGRQNNGAQSLTTDSYGSELECAEDCKNANCKFLAIWVGSFCDIWTGIITPSEDETPWKWYEPGCFCDFPEPEPEAAQTAP